MSSPVFRGRQRLSVFHPPAVTRVVKNEVDGIAGFIKNIRASLLLFFLPFLYKNTVSHFLA